MAPIVDIKCSKCGTSYYSNSDGFFAPSCVCDKYPDVKDAVTCAICPVCHGKGIVASGFYITNSYLNGQDWAITTDATTGSVNWTTTEQCHSCGGKGIVWK